VPRHARLDPRATARIVRRAALRYGPDTEAALDLGPHVRAASALVRWGDELWIVQDDTAAIAVLSLVDGTVRARPLPLPTAGGRRFDPGRGDKRRKRDLEAACLLELDGAPHLIAFGSGSSPWRESVALVPLGGAPARVVPLPRLYAAWRARGDFAGSELNVEGALAIGDRLLLAQRGNGAPAADRAPVNAIAALSLPGLVALIAAPEVAAVPPLTEVEPWELGAVGGARLTFTDLTATPAGVLFAAAAEASPDALRDGPVTGVVVGRLADGAAALLLDEAGRPSCDKVEGIAHAADGRLFAVVDRDDPAVPAELLEIALPPAWGAA